MKAKIVVKSIHAHVPDEVFENAEVAVAAPGLFIIQGLTEQYGMFPIGAVASILFPEGDTKVSIM